MDFKDFSAGLRASRLRGFGRVWGLSAALGFAVLDLISSAFMWDLASLKHCSSSLENYQLHVWRHILEL